MSTLRLKVARRVAEADGICSYELVSADGAALPPFTAGAHVDVHVGEGIVRQYSLCNAPHETHRYLIGVLREPASRGGSSAMHERIAEGAELDVSVPRNHFGLADGPHHSVLFAGGIGITPLLAMAEHLHAKGLPFTLHYSVRSAARAAFRGRLEQAPFASRVRLHIDEEGTGLDVAAALSDCPAGTHVYVCGPAGYIDHVLATARSLGWSDDRLHREYFGAAPAVAEEGGAFDVRIASSGTTYTIPAGRTVVQVLADHGIDVPVSCEQGVCGTCLTRVLEGIPEHRDLYQTEEEQAANDHFTPCCSRAKSALLVLDL
ncbi:PDR/VanB family oxidoreductase [Pseudoduganella albidiflava]|uniref:Oxidoreductase n=1 Tax=Pseudoduganella albidiflava TaxID=321983 RepID=A0A411WZS0_9BURK|nr:PDR/VanB family oxidoreductase [Pseudoduganella albidiflava]QBI02193.1 oxidoreductase [Pseudoduganella albidiflava]GGY59827.1 vanillate O-demethylase oxidoreductase [Pseudoduganella albidiflava]